MASTRDLVPCLSPIFTLFGAPPSAYDPLALLLIAVVGVALFLFGLAAVVCCFYLLALAVASAFHRVSPVTGRPVTRLVVVIPAHNEAALVARCVDSILRQPYPADLRRVVVIADNCSDDTAAVARAAGAQVMVRDQPDARGKGQALDWAIRRLAMDPFAPQALAVVDADSVADGPLLAALEAELVRGHPVVQAEYLVLEEAGSLRSQLVRAGFLLFHRVRFAGRARLGMACNLVGNGMLFSAQTLERHPWNAFSGVEDLEYSIDLRLAGVKPRFTAAARVLGPMPSGRDAARQRLRWEGGRFFIVRHRLGSLLRGAFRRQDWSLLDAALDLAVPPLGLLALTVLAGSAVSGLLVVLHAVPGWMLTPWLFALAAIPAYVVIGLRAAHAPASIYRALLAAPAFLLMKALVYARIVRGVDASRWERSRRPTDAPEQPASRFFLRGVPIDPVEMPATVDRIMAAASQDSVRQVCTINLDFLRSAHRDPEVARVFAESEINIPDGAPIVWLGRALGWRVPGRVAGADLVPQLARAAAGQQVSLFLLGGEHGVAEMAARSLSQNFPGLQIAGWHEPPRAPIESMDNDAILREINASGAGILLVAFGHPKQDKWIHRHRDRLHVGAAIGVGCAFDLLAGRQRRAPGWMHGVGLEWLFRLLQEPGRLLPRYAADAMWLAVVTLVVLSQRLANGPGAASAR